MKSKIMLTMALVVFALGTSFAQDRQGKGDQADRQPKGQMEWLGLTEDQATKVKALKVDHQKQMIAHKNQLDEKEAALKTKMATDNPDKKAIIKLVEEKGQIKTTMDKINVEHRLAVRQLLNEEQKVKFDSQSQRAMHKGKMGGQGQGRNRN